MVSQQIRPHGFAIRGSRLEYKRNLFYSYILRVNTYNRFARRLICIRNPAPGLNTGHLRGTKAQAGLNSARRILGPVCCWWADASGQTWAKRPSASVNQSLRPPSSPPACPWRIPRPAPSRCRRHHHCLRHRKRLRRCLR